MNNDLISREELKKDLKQYFTDGVLDGISAKLAFNQILHDIDNAPTVEPEKALIANVAFDEDKLKEIVHTEVIDKIKSGELVLKDERPQGEWLTHRVAFYLTCPFCGCNLRALKSEVFLDADDDYNFCPSCGADMRGGSE